MPLKYFSLILVLLIALTSCEKRSGERVEGPSEGDSLTFSVQQAPEWTALFKRDSGWFGGDGIFAIPFSGDDRSPSDSIMFVFSDTMFGEIRNDSLLPGFSMVNNSVMFLEDASPEVSRSSFRVLRDEKGAPATLFLPHTKEAVTGDYYWLGDGFVNTSAGHTLYLFAYRIHNTEDGSPFPFKEVGNSLIVIPHGSSYPYTDQRQFDIPFDSTQDSVHTSYGVGIFSDLDGGNPNGDGYVYVYGVRGPSKELVAARVHGGRLEKFDEWQFYNGKDWLKDPGSAVALTDSVSNELSVSFIGNGKYALIYEYGGLMPEIMMQIGPSPVGPFGERQVLYKTNSDIHEKGLFTYNAKAHPAISRPGELLVSYNVNSFDFNKRIHEIPHLYRPHFIRVTFHQTPEK